MTLNGSSYQSSDIPVVKGIFYALAMTILSLMTLFGNGLVVLAFIKFKRLRTIPNYFIVSLATADILVPILREIYVTVAAFLRSWPFGEAWCHGSATCSFMLCASSIAHLTCISIERMICIRFPFHYNVQVTSTKVIVVIIHLWLFSIVTGLFPHFRLGDIEFNSDVMECEVNWRTTKRDKILVSLLVGCFYVLPLTVMIVSYGVIFSVARRQVRRISVLEGRMSSVGPIRRELKAVKIISVIVGVFFVMWLPYFMSTVSRVVNRGKVSPDVLRLSLVLGYGNSCCNPIIYTLMNRTLRNAFKRIVRCNRVRVSAAMGSSLDDHGAGGDTRQFRRSRATEPVDINIKRSPRLAHCP